MLAITKAFNLGMPSLPQTANIVSRIVFFALSIFSRVPAPYPVRDLDSSDVSLCYAPFFCLCIADILFCDLLGDSSFPEHHSTLFMLHLAHWECVCVLLWWQSPLSWSLNYFLYIYFLLFMGVAIPCHPPPTWMTVACQ